MFYFAFGANMSANVFVDRRGMKPLRKDRGKVMGFRSAFVEPGLPPLEPVFAGLVKDETAECWGGVWELNEADAHALDRYESGGYERIQVTVETELFGKVGAFAYATTNPVFGRKPSRRYLRLLVQGAEEFELPENVIRALRETASTHIPVLSDLVPLVAKFADRIRKTRA